MRPPQSVPSKPLPPRSVPPQSVPSTSLPPASRSRAGLRLTAAAALGRFELQRCARCSAVQYPPREACHRCLSTQLLWTLQSGEGELISQTTLHHSHERYFRDRLPWRVGMVRLASGPTVLAHLHGAVAAAPARVRVSVRLDKAGQAVLIAVPAGEEMIDLGEDRQLKEMTCDPRNRRVLVTDGSTAVGCALVRALIAAGADKVWVGDAGADGTTTLAELSGLSGVTLVPMDVTRAESVAHAAAAIADQVDILVSNCERNAMQAGREAVSGAPDSPRAQEDAARAEMDVNYFGLLRLAQEFGPAMRKRNAGGPANAIAWVNLLSVYAMSNFPPRGTFSASMAAAYSLSQWLRAQMQAAGIRVMTVFPGPIEPGALARAVVEALQDGLEELYPGDVAQQWLERWLESPKVLERELAVGR
ncbi:MAG: SDR family NAD(P)-dependent oxidoreductase [Steroidobacteraceae bacterium]